MPKDIICPSTATVQEAPAVLRALRKEAKARDAKARNKLKKAEQANVSFAVIIDDNSAELGKSNSPL